MENIITEQTQAPAPSLVHVAREMVAFAAHNQHKTLALIIGMALITSVLELITATTIVIFSQVLQNPQQYLSQAMAYKLPYVTSDSSFLIFTAAACAAVYCIKNSWTALEVYTQQKSIQRLNWMFKKKLLRRYATADYSYYASRKPAYNMSVVASDTEVVFSNALTSLTTIASECIVFIALIAMIAYMNPSLILVLSISGAAIAAIMMKVLMPRFYSWGQRYQESGLKSFHHLNQFFFGFKDILLTGKQEKFIESYAEAAKARAMVQSLQGAGFAWPRMVLETAFMILVVMTIMTLVWMDQTPQQIMGIMGAYLYAGFRLLPGLNRIITALNMLKGATPSVMRVAEEWKIFPPQGQYSDTPDLHFNERIDLRHVSFNYHNSERTVLKDINLVINKGETLGIIGATGSGKSTLLDIILGLLKPSSGTVLIDQRFPATSIQWHRRIGYVPQMISLADDTIAANIAFGDTQQEIDNTKLMNAIREAQLSDFIQKLPMGVNTTVGDRGLSVSGGERQRIAIARALYNQPEILVFDEATSALDNDTEAKVMETIRNVAQTRTVIMVAHRLSTLKDCDRIVEMKDGEIVRIEQNIETKKAQRHG